ADQIAWSENAGDQTDYLAPIVADAKAGFGGALNAHELMKAMIRAGAAGVHFEDQLAAEKKCGHLRDRLRHPLHVAVDPPDAVTGAAPPVGVHPFSGAELLPPRPNPVAGRAVIPFSVAAEGPVRLALFDGLG